MILIHRVTPFAIGAIGALGFASLLEHWMAPQTSVLFTLVLMALLFARLLVWRVRTFAFWHFFATPLLYLLAAFSMLFLFEGRMLSLILSVVSVILLVLFAEYLFQFTHLPSQYQPYSIEYLTLLLNILTIFSLSSFAYGAHLLIQFPLWILATGFFLFFWFVLYGTLWVSKAEDSGSRPYALAGAILTTEFFVTLSFLPSGLYTNASFITLFFYLFLGLTRAQVRHKLSSTVVKRYLIVAAILFAAVLVSSDWS
ncbi:hypothetical protein HZA85_02700 [Candidatus Uhrbacteria bacterium]|nr:hypothetical protein [Candidatus Uhrbacteria bacterium]